MINDVNILDNLDDDFYHHANNPKYLEVVFTIQEDGNKKQMGLKVPIPTDDDKFWICEDYSFDDFGPTCRP